MNYEAHTGQPVTRAVSDSIFDEYRHRIATMERMARELASVLSDRNTRLFGVDGPPTAAPVMASNSPAPSGPLTNEVSAALTSLDDALNAISYQVHRQGGLG